MQYETFSGSPYEKFFGLQSRLANVAHALEFGSADGWGAIWLANQKHDLHVSTIEQCEHHAVIARRNIKEARLASRITVFEDSGEMLQKSPYGSQIATSERVGFCYIDADRPDVSADFDMAVRLSYPGACILVDNVMQWGVKEGEKPRNSTPPWRENKAKAVKAIGKDERVDGVMMQTIGKDGFEAYIMAVVL